MAPSTPSANGRPDEALDGLAQFCNSRLVMLGGYGSDGTGSQHWRSMWAALKQYSSQGADPSKEDLERSHGCNCYHRDVHMLRIGGPGEGAAQWQSLPVEGMAARLLARTGHSLTSLMQRRTLLLFGGANHQQSGGGFMNDAWTIQLDVIGEGTVVHVAEMCAGGVRPSPRAHHSASLLGGAVYIVGGCSLADRPLHDVHRLDTRSWSWSQPEVRGKPPAALCRHSATTMLGAIFIFGGCTSLRQAGKHGSMASGESSSSIQQTFSAQLHILCEVQDGRRGRMVGDESCALSDGGDTGNSGPTLQWEAVRVTGQAPSGRADHAACAAGGRLYVFGGRKLVKPSSRPAPASALASAYGEGGNGKRGGMAARARAAPCSELFCFDPRSRRWECLTRSPTLRREASSVVAIGGAYLFAFGGWRGASGTQDDGKDRSGSTAAAHRQSCEKALAPHGKGHQGPQILPWSNDLHVLHLPSMVWYRIQTDGHIPAPRHGHAMDLIDITETDAQKCTLTGSALTSAIAGKASAFRIVARDSSGVTRRNGGDLFRIFLRRRSWLHADSVSAVRSMAEPTSERSVSDDRDACCDAALASHHVVHEPKCRCNPKVVVHDHLDGTYTASYIATMAGEYDLIVELVPPTPPPAALSAGATPSAGDVLNTNDFVQDTSQRSGIASAGASEASASLSHRPAPLPLQAFMTSSHRPPPKPPESVDFSPRVSLIHQEAPVRIGPASSLLRVAPAKAHGLSARMPVSSAISGSIVGPIHVQVVDAFGNPLSGRCPRLRVTVAACTRVNPHASLLQVFPGRKNSRYPDQHSLGQPPHDKFAPAQPMRTAEKTSDIALGAQVTCELFPSLGDMLHALDADTVSQSVNLPGSCETRWGANPPDTEERRPGPEGQASGTHMWIRLMGPASRVKLLFSCVDEISSLQPACCEIQLLGPVAALRASCPTAVAIPGRAFGPVSVSAVDAEGFPTLLSDIRSALQIRIGGCDLEPGEWECDIETIRRAGGHGQVDSSCENTRTCDCNLQAEGGTICVDGGGSLTNGALLWIQIRGPPGNVTLYLSYGEGSLVTCTQLDIYVSGPPYWLRLTPPSSAPTGSHYQPQGVGSKPSNMTKTTGDLSLAIDDSVDGCQGVSHAIVGKPFGPVRLEVVDCYENVLTCSGIEPHVEIIHRDETDRVESAAARCDSAGSSMLGMASNSDINGHVQPLNGAHVSREATCDERVQCNECHATLANVRWLCDPSSGISCAAELMIDIEGTVGEYILRISDLSKFVCKPSALQLVMEPGPTAPHCCKLSPLPFHEEALCAGELRWITLWCRDAHGNAAPIGRDRVEISLEALGVEAYEDIPSGVPSETRDDALHLLRKVVPLQGGRYRVGFGAKRSGAYAFSLKCNGVLVVSRHPSAADHVLGVPIINVVAAPPTALRLIRSAPKGAVSPFSAPPVLKGTSDVDYATALQLPAGQILTLQVEPIDAFGNSSADALSDVLSSSTQARMVAQLHELPSSPSAGSRLLTQVEAIARTKDGWYKAESLSNGTAAMEPLNTPTFLCFEWRLLGSGRSDGKIEARVAVGGKVNTMRLRFLVFVHDNNRWLECSMVLNLAPGSPSAVNSEILAEEVGRCETVFRDADAPNRAVCITAGSAGGFLQLDLRDAWGNPALSFGAEHNVRVQMLQTGSDISATTHVKGSHNAVGTSTAPCAEARPTASGMMRDSELTSAPTRFGASHGAAAGRRDHALTTSKIGRRDVQGDGPNARAWACIEVCEHNILLLKYGAYRAGQYELQVTIDSRHVRGSPVRLRIVAAVAHSFATRLPQPTAASGALYGPIELWCTDAYGNMTEYGVDDIEPTLCDISELASCFVADGQCAPGQQQSHASRQALAGACGGKLARRSIFIRTASGGVEEERDRDADKVTEDTAEGIRQGRAQLNTEWAARDEPITPHAGCVEVVLVRLVQLGAGRARLFLRLSGPVGGCRLGVSDRRGKVMGAPISIAIVPGAPHALRASCHSSCIVRDHPFGPVCVSLIDAAGNYLPAGNLPLRVDARYLPRTHEEQQIGDEHVQQAVNKASTTQPCLSSITAACKIGQEESTFSGAVNKRQPIHLSATNPHRVAPVSTWGPALIAPRRRTSRLATDLAAALAFDEECSPGESGAEGDLTNGNLHFARVGDLITRQHGVVASVASSIVDIEPPNTDGSENILCRVVSRDVRSNSAGQNGLALLQLCVDGAAAGMIQLRIACDPDAGNLNAAFDVLNSVSKSADVAASASNKQYEPLPVVLTMQLSTGLVFFSENSFLSQALRSRGWREVRSLVEVPFIHFIWTIKSSDIDFHLLHPGQLCNHFEYNDVATKVGIAETLRESCRWQAHCDPRAFFPRSYDLTNDDERSVFLRDFETSAASALLRRFMKEGESCNCSSDDAHGAADFTKNQDRSAASPVHVAMSPGNKRGGALPLPLVHAALDIVNTALRNNGCTGNIDSPQRIPNASAALLPEIIKAASLSASLNLEALDGHEEISSSVQSTRTHEDTVVAHEKLRQRVVDTLSTLQRLDPQWRIEGTHNVWVLKPSYGSNGLGMRLFNQGALRMLAESRSQRVVQKYIERPLLVQGYKFDIRCWVLVVDWAPLKLWMYDECLLRFCSEPFSLDQLSNKFAHIANVSVQRQYDMGSVNYSKEGGTASLNDGRRISASSCVGRIRASSAGHTRRAPLDLGSSSTRRVAHAAMSSHAPSNGKRLVNSVGVSSQQAPLSANLCDSSRLREELASLGMHGAWDNQILPAIRRITAATMLSAQERAKPRRGSFEIYGLDFVIDEDLEPWLIEVNESPNLSANGSDMKARLLTVMVEELVQLLIDEAEMHPDRKPRGVGEMVGRWLLIHADDDVMAADTIGNIDTPPLNVVGTQLRANSKLIA